MRYDNFIIFSIDKFVYICFRLPSTSTLFLSFLYGPVLRTSRTTTNRKMTPIHRMTIQDKNNKNKIFLKCITPKSVIVHQLYCNLFLQFLRTPWLILVLQNNKILYYLSSRIAMHKTRKSLQNLH